MSDSPGAQEHESEAPAVREPPSRRGRRRAVRLVAEFFTVFIGVVGALLADDWRERNSERRTAREGLAQVHVDLLLDSTEFLALRESVREQERGAAWLLVHLARPDVPPDSVTRVMSDVTTGRLYQPSGPSYRSLRDGGNLHLLEDTELRGEIVRYYEDTQVYLRELYALTESAARDVERRLIPYRRRSPNAESLGFGIGSRWSLTVDPAEILEDQELVSALGLFGGRASYLGGRLDDLFIPENARIRGRVGESIEGR